MAKREGYERQEKDSREMDRKIRETLSDGKSHRYNELQKETKLSTKTLSAHLKALENSGIVVKFEGFEPVYPKPVYYALNQSFPRVEELQTVAKAINDNFKKTLDLEDFFRGMNDYLNLNLLIVVPIIRSLKEDVAKTTFKDRKTEEEVQKVIPAGIGVLFDLYVKDVADFFARQFVETMLNEGANLDDNQLMKEFVERTKERRLKEREN